MKRIMMLILVAAMLLCSCAPAQQEESSQPSTEASQNTEQSEATQDTQETEQTEATQATEETEPPVLYRNPLTGEPIDAPATNRPFCIMLNNSAAAMPQHGIGAADIVYETLIEGETRMMGVYYDMTEAPTFGAIRSARRYFVEIAQSYDAIYVHNGSSNHPTYGAEKYFEDTGWNHMDGITSPNAWKHFYRDTDRKNQGYAYEHTLFIKSGSVLDMAKELKFRTASDTEYDYGLNFDDGAVIVGETVKQLTVWFNMSGSPTKWHEYTRLTYNPETKLYSAYLHERDHVDGNTGEVVAFRNVLVLRTDIHQLTGSSWVSVDTVGSGTGYFSCNGQLVPIRWSRKSTEDPFVYTLENGTPITFGVGSTYIALVPMKATLEVK